MTLPWKKKNGGKSKDYYYGGLCNWVPRNGFRSQISPFPCILYLFPFTRTTNSKHRVVIATSLPSTIATRFTWIPTSLSACSTLASIHSSGIALRDLSGSLIHISTARTWCKQKLHIFTSVASHPAKHPRIAPCDGLSRDLRRLQTPS